MDALILAAGYGSRLSQLFSSKPLATIHGTTLLELSLRQLASAGVRRAVVVTGHRAGLVERALDDIRPRLEIEIVAERVDDWSKPNGYSVMAGASLLPGEYLLVMCDHILSGSILRDLAHVTLSDCDVALAIDYGLESPLIDPHDATWVKTRADGLIDRIGKSIPERDAVDCGAFLANAALVDAIEEALVAGKPGSLSDGMQVLADRRRAATLDVTGAWWLDVDDPHAYDLAHALLDPTFARLDEPISTGNTISIVEMAAPA